MKCWKRVLYLLWGGACLLSMTVGILQDFRGAVTKMSQFWPVFDFLFTLFILCAIPTTGILFIVMVWFLLPSQRFKRLSVEIEKCLSEWNCFYGLSTKTANDCVFIFALLSKWGIGTPKNEEMWLKYLRKMRAYTSHGDYKGAAEFSRDFTLPSESDK